MTQNPCWDVSSPACERVTTLRAQIDSWLRLPELTQLAREFGDTPPAAEVEDLLSWFDNFSAKYWDFRAGRERNLAEVPALTRAQEECVMAFANAAGMVEPSPPERRSYDFCLILGGLVRACLTRPRFAAALHASGYQFGRTVALGGFRRLAGDEIPLASRLGIDGANEFEAMDAGLRHSFSLDEDPRVESGDGSLSNRDWRVHSYQDGRFQVIAAPSTEPERRRANSGDTFTWWASFQGAVSSGSAVKDAHVLLVTNPIYVPYQSAAATELLAIPHDVQVETVGVSSQAADLGSDTQHFEPFRYLQEIRSAVRGLRSLLLAAQRA